jgi:hypothetical protein
MRARRMANLVNVDEGKKLLEIVLFRLLSGKPLA